MFFVKKYDFENAIFVKNGLLKCDFGEKCDFENAIFVKRCDFKNVNFGMKCGFLPQCAKVMIGTKVKIELHFSKSKMQLKRI